MRMFSNDAPFQDQQSTSNAGPTPGPGRGPTDIEREFSEAVDRLLADTFALKRMLDLGVNIGLWYLMRARLGVEPLGVDGGEFVQPVSAYGEFVDLVTWPPSHPTRFRLRHGQAVVLGDVVARWAAATDRPLKVFSTPLAWLRGFGEGACILDWTAHLPFHLPARRLVVDDACLADRINRAMASPPPVYEIKVAA